MASTSTPDSDPGARSVRALLREAQAALGGGQDSVLDAELLVAAASGRDRAALLAHPEDEVGGPALETFNSLLGRRVAGEPMAYLLGTWGFWTLDLAVGPGVLVPRPETELLVELAGERISDPFARVLDLGTGSGAIALAIASEHPQAEVTATEASDTAFAYARRNLRDTGMEVELLLGDPDDWYLTVTARRFDLILSNPPYVAIGDPALEAAVAAHEPSAALLAGDDGLDALRAIIAGAPEHLEIDGWLLVEHGYDQGPAVRALFATAGFSEVSTRRDLAGHERVTLGRLD